MSKRHKPIPVIDSKATKRFWSKVDKRRKDECWNWLAACGSHGNYGSFGLAGQGTFYTHRIAWKLATGQDPGDLKVLHHCDNGKCVNPSHLFLGTQVDNIQDMVLKKRQRGDHRPGEKCPTSKLKDADVIAIRESRKKYALAELAEKYNVCQATISLICNRRTWRHV